MKLLLRLKDFRLQLRERNSRADWPELRDDRLKVEIFQLGAKIAPLKTRRCKRVAHIASPQTRRLKKYRVYRSHMCLYIDFTWDSVAQKNSFAFGVNAPLHLEPRNSGPTEAERQTDNGWVSAVTFPVTELLPFIPSSSNNTQEYTHPHFTTKSSKHELYQNKIVIKTEMDHG